MPVAILIAVLLCALILIPLGLPGTWLIVASAFVYKLAIPAGGVTTTVVVGTAVLAVIAEVLEFGVAGQLTQKYGGSKRAGYGAMIGGFIGVIVGVPVPIIGPVIGGLVGAFLGALAGELQSGSGHQPAARVAIGAVIARVIAQALKIAVAIAMAAWIVAAAVRSA